MSDLTTIKQTATDLLLIIWVLSNKRQKSVRRFLKHTASLNAETDEKDVSPNSDIRQLQIRRLAATSGFQTLKLLCFECNVLQSLKDESYALEG